MAVSDYIYDNWGNATEIDCLFEELPIHFRMTSRAGSFDVEEPALWSDVPIKHKRSTEYHGFNYEFMGGDISLKFDTVAGLEIIREEYELNGNDGEIVLQKYTVWEGNEYILYEGKLNLNSLKRENYYYSCTVERKSLHELINSRMDTTLKFVEDKDLDDNPISPLDPWGVELKSRVLNETFKSKKTKPEEVEHIITNQTDQQVFAFFNTSEPNVNTIKGFLGNIAGISSDHTMIYNNPFIIFEHNGSYTVNANLSFQLHSKIVPKVKWLSRKDIEWYELHVGLALYRDGWDGEGAFDGYLKQYWPIYPTTVTNIPNPTRTCDTGKITTSISSVEMDVEVGDRLILYAAFFIRVEPGGDRLASQTTTLTQFSAEVNISGQSDMPNSKHSCILIKECIDRAFYKITGTTGNIESNFYSRVGSGQLVDGCGANRALMSGRELRASTYDPIAGLWVDMSVTLKTLLSSLDAVDCIGLGYEWDPENKEEIIRIEPRDYFYRNVEVVKINDVYEFSEEVARDYIYNNIEVGYEKYNEDDVNSLDEAHAYHEYQTPIKSDGKKLQLKSKVILSGYLIEITRRQTFSEDENKATTYDDDTFMIDVYREDSATSPTSQWKPVTDAPFSSVTGTLSPETTYNLLHTPKRMLMAHSKWLSSCLIYKGGSSVIKNTFTKQNRDLETSLQPSWPCSNGDDFGLPLKESSDIILSAFSDSFGIYSPEIVRFKAYLSRGQVRYIINAHRGISEDENNYGYITYTDDHGNEQKGWLYEMEYDRMKGEAKMTLLKKKFP